MPTPNKGRSVKGPSDRELLETLCCRLQNLEDIIMHAKLSQIVAPPDNVINVSSFHPLFTQKGKMTAMLENLYPLSSGETECNLVENPINWDCAGFSPSDQHWAGLFLGGCEQNSEQRRLYTIPFAMRNAVPFMSPHGLSHSQKDDMESRRLGQLTCTHGIIDLTNDHKCLYYTAGWQLVYFLALGFTSITMVGFPVNKLNALLLFDKEETYKNINSSWNVTTLRQRREDYYNIITAILEKVPRIQNVSSIPVFERDFLNDRQAYLTPRFTTPQYILTIMERLAIYKHIASLKFETDIGEALCIIFGNLIFCEAMSAEFLDTEMKDDWRRTRQNYESLRLHVNKRFVDILENVDPAKYNDEQSNVKAFVDLINMTDYIISLHPHMK